jgi:tripartite-type tricarboxylate transporter receptor subunit TctC
MRPLLHRIGSASVGLLALALMACAPAAGSRQAAAPSPAPAAAVPPAPAPSSPASAASATGVDTRAVEEFYRGKTLRLVVASTPGGGFDTFARVLAKYMGKYVPGNPAIIVENMPGAGHVLAANMIYNTGRKDGTVMVNFSSAPILANFFDDPGAQLDSTKYNWLGVRELDHVACAVSRTSGFNRLEEATGARQLILGGLAPASNTDTVPNLLRNLLGLNIKVVSGYPGVSQIRLAVEQNELHGVCFSWSGMKSTWKDELATGEIKVIAQAGKKPHPDLPNVPMIQDLATTDEQRQLIEAGIILPLEFAQAYAMPPGVPAERVQAMREAYLATLQDAEFLAEARRLQFEIDPVTGEQVEQAIKKLFSLPPEMRAKLQAAFEG